MIAKDVQPFSKMKLPISLREKKNVILKKENIIYLFTILIIFYLIGTQKLNLYTN